MMEANDCTQYPVVYISQEEFEEKYSHINTELLAREVRFLSLKFIYSEKATTFCEIFIFVLRSARQK